MRIVEAVEFGVGGTETWGQNKDIRSQSEIEVNCPMEHDVNSSTVEKMLGSRTA